MTGFGCAAVGGKWGFELGSSRVTVGHLVLQEMNLAVSSATRTEEVDIGGNAGNATGAA